VNASSTSWRAEKGLNLNVKKNESSKKRVDVKYASKMHFLNSFFDRKVENNRNDFIPEIFLFKFRFLT